MNGQTRVKVIKEVSKSYESSWTLCFQWCEYIYGEDQSEYGYRFIWKRPDGTLQAARGQARIPNFADMQELISLSAREGWLITCEYEEVN